MVRRRLKSQKFSGWKELDIGKLVCLAQPETVDLGLIYDYFTNDATSSRFMTSIVFQVKSDFQGF